VTLKPGETRTVQITAEPKLLADWNDGAHGWTIAAGRYDVFAGPNAEAAASSAAVQLGAQNLAQ
jgi:beta-glucosidase